MSNSSLDSVSSLYCSITSVSASISTEKLSFAFAPNGMTRNGNKIKTINFHTPDDFIHLLGKQDFLRNQLGLDYNSIAKKLKNL